VITAEGEEAAVRRLDIPARSWMDFLAEGPPSAP
jgi:hypothetical protein